MPSSFRFHIEPVSALVVADYILWKRAQEDISTTTLDILKLVYLSHGWFLGIHGIPLIIEAVEAWAYGPVVPVVYEKFKSYRGNPIDIVPVNSSDRMDARQVDVIDETVHAYREFSSWELSAVTHKPGSPWHQIYSRDDIWSIIPNFIIKEHYGNLLAKRGAK